MAKAKIKITWHDKQVRKEVKRTLRSRLAVVGEMVRAEVVRNLSTSTRAEGPSKPDQFPHLDTGKLRQSYFSEMSADGTEVVIGSPLKYAYWLETGTHKMAPRPALQRTLLSFQMRSAIAEVLGVRRRDVKVTIGSKKRKSK